MFRLSSPWRTALEAPPVPSISAFLWCGRRRGLMLCVNPMMSLLYPMSLTSLSFRTPDCGIPAVAPRRMAITFTAPIFRASGLMSSSCGMMASLCGMVQLSPRSMGCCLTMSRNIPASGISKFRYSASMPSIMNFSVKNRLLKLCPKG